MSDKPLDLTVEIAPQGAVRPRRSCARHLPPSTRRWRPFPAVCTGLPHDGRLSGPEPGLASERPAHPDLPRSVPDAFPGGRRLRARPAGAPVDLDAGAAGRRAAQRRLAPGLHGRRAAHLRDAPEPRPTSRCSSSISTASTAAGRGAGARASSASRPSARSAATRIEVPVSAHADRLDQPQGSRRSASTPQLLDFVRRSGVERPAARLPRPRRTALGADRQRVRNAADEARPGRGAGATRCASSPRSTAHAMANPRAVPAKTLGYAKYDLVRVLNEGLDRLGLRGSMVEKAARPHAGRARGALLPHAPLGQPAGPERRRRRRRHRRRHLPEPHPGAVAARAAASRAVDVSWRSCSSEIQRSEFRTCRTGDRRLETGAARYLGIRSGISAAT